MGTPVADYGGLGKRVHVRSGYYYTPTWPWDNYSVNVDGTCASDASGGTMCVQMDDGTQDWFPSDDVTFLE